MRKGLEERIIILEAKLESIQFFLRELLVKLEKIDSLEFPKEEGEEKVKSQTEAKQVVDIKAEDGAVLAKAYISNGEIVIEPQKDFDVNYPAFKKFFVEKFLAAKVNKDRERAILNEITPDQILTYRIYDKNGTLKQILIRNYREERRLKEIHHAVKWSLQKAYEKQSSNPVPKSEDWKKSAVEENVNPYSF